MTLVIWKKSNSKSEKIWTIWKKPKLNSEMILKIWKKCKLKCEKIWKIWKISVSHNYTQRDLLPSSCLTPPPPPPRRPHPPPPSPPPPSTSSFYAADVIFDQCRLRSCHFRWRYSCHVTSDCSPLLPTNAALYPPLYYWHVSLITFTCTSCFTRSTWRIRFTSWTPSYYLV